MKGYNCKCESEYRFISNNGGNSIECQKCEEDKVQSLDGFSCIAKNSTQSVNPCPNCQFAPIDNKLCLDDSFPMDLDIQGNQLVSRVCIQCNVSSSLRIDKKCKSCLPYVYLEDSNLDMSSIDCSKLSKIGGLLFEKESIEDQPKFFNSMFGENKIDSEVFQKYGPLAYRTCKLESKRNISSCQLLANLCVLNLYKKKNSSESDLCDSFENINLNFNSNKTLPWITFNKNYQKYAKEYAADGILNNLDQDKYLKIKLDSKELAFYAAEFSLNGELIDFKEIDFNKLNLCNSVSASPFSISSIDIKCSIKTDSLFEMSGKTGLTFVDLYLKYGNGSNLFALPVKINDERSTINSEQIQRRFFLLESVSSKRFNPLGRKQAIDEVYVRYAKSVTISFELLKDKTDGEIYPPTISIIYDYAKQSDVSKLVEVNFKVEYKMNLSGYRTPLFTLIGTFGGFAFIWSTVRVWNWNRRIGRFTIDTLFLFKYLMFLMGSFSNAIQAGIIVSALYFLIFYR